MANILIIGFMQKEALTIRDKVDTVVRKIGESSDTVTTILGAGTKTKWCKNNARAPYLVVRNTKIERARKIAEALNKELKLDVEYEQINGFLVARSLSS